MTSNDPGANPMMVVMGLLFLAAGYVNYRWGGTFVADQRKARWYGLPAAVLFVVAGAALVIVGFWTFF